MNQHSDLPIRGHRCELYTRPKVTQFEPAGTSIQTLAEYLQNLDNNTSLHPIYDPSEIQMTPSAQMRHDGFRFTASAFRQAAQILCPGLSKLLPDLAGTIRRIDDERIRLVDGRCAVALWNELVDLRFQLFERYRIIRNDQERTIEGFVSHKHQYLENLGLYREAVETVTGHDPDISVYAAILTGRRFAIWFRHRDPVFTLTIDNQPWPFHRGYYFTNGEATGTSVRGTMALFTPRGVCLGSYRKFGRRVTHVGKDFMTRLGSMFAAVVHSDVAWDKIEEGAKLLATKSLGFAVDGTDEQRKERCRKVSHALGVLGVQKNIAVDVTAQALAIGRAYGMTTTSWSQTHQLYASRTLLDLFVPLLGTARQLDLTRREKIEQAAFDILTGRLLL